MPAKKMETKTTVNQKGTTPVEEPKKKTAAKPKTEKAVKKTATKAKKTTETAKKAKQTTKKTETLKDTAAGVEAKKTAVVEKKTPAKKTTAKKASTKKTTAKATPKKTTVKKTTTKKSVTKADALKSKLDQYRQFSVDTCIDMAKAMGIELGYDQYANLLLDHADYKELASSILKEYQIDAKKFNYDDDGYDTDLMEILIEKVAETVTIKASDFDKMADEIKSHEGYEIQDDGLANNDEYNADFDLVKRLLMIAQRKNVTSMSALQEFVKADATALIEKFMDVAYAVLKNWQYDDVKYYENFIYTVLSQFEDLYARFENRAMMDVADLYIEHGDYGLGDANYRYVLRENELKDYIYYRFANVYRDIDREKCRALASEALQVVDERFTYHPQIVQLLQE